MFHGTVDLLHACLTLLFATQRRHYSLLRDLCVQVYVTEVEGGSIVLISVGLLRCKVSPIEATKTKQYRSAAHVQVPAIGSESSYHDV